MPPIQQKLTIQLMPAMATLLYSSVHTLAATFDTVHHYHKVWVWDGGSTGFSNTFTEHTSWNISRYFIIKSTLCKVSCHFLGYNGLIFNCIFKAAIGLIILHYCKVLWVRSLIYRVSHTFSAPLVFSLFSNFYTSNKHTIYFIRLTIPVTPTVKKPKGEDDLSHRSSNRIKNAWSCTSNTNIPSRYTA
jgi:hypothetical protein